MNLSSLLTYGLISTVFRAFPLLVMLPAGVVYSPADFGYLAGGVAAFTLCVGLAEAGLDSSASLIVGRGRRPDQVVASLQSIRTILAALLTFTLLAFLIWKLEGEFHVRIGLTFLSGLALLSATAAATQRFLARTVNPTRELRILGLEKSVAAAAFLVFVFSGADAVFAFLGLLCGQFLGAGLVVMMGPRIGFRGTEIPALIREAAPFILSTAAANLTWRIGVLFLAFTGNHVGAGNLAAGMLPIQALGMLSVASAPLVLLRGLPDDPGQQITWSKFFLVGVAVAGLVQLGVLGFRSVDLEIGVLTARETLSLVSVLALVLPFSIANPMVGARLRLKGAAMRVSVAALVGSATAVGAVVLWPVPEGAALGLVVAEATVLVIMLLPLRLPPRDHSSRVVDHL